MDNKLIQKIEKIKFLGIPVGRRVYLPESVKIYAFGLRIGKFKRGAVKKKVIIKKEGKNKKEKEIIKDLNVDNLNIAVVCSGTLSNIAVCLNWLSYLRCHISEENIFISMYISERNDLRAIKQIFNNSRIVNVFYTGKPKNDYFDCVFCIEKYPKVLKVNEKKVLKYSEWLLDYIYSLKKFNVKFNRFMVTTRYNTLFEIFSDILSRNTLQKLDIGNLLEIDKNFNISVSCVLDEAEYLNKMQLKQFITVHTQRISPDGINLTKLWPNSYYNILLKKIKDKYPYIEIVQLGRNYEDDLNVDMNLSGKIGTEEEKVLLKNSLLHIDFDNDYVTLRELLTDKKSIVLFGPTSPELYGFENNINIRTNACTHPCEQVIKGWKKNCINQYANRSCMLSILPDNIFHLVCESLNGAEDE